MKIRVVIKVSKRMQRPGYIENKQKWNRKIVKKKVIIGGEHNYTMKKTSVETL